MQIISKEQKAVLPLIKSLTNREKTPLRRDVEALQPGQVGLFKHNTDYTKYDQVYSAVYATKKDTGRNYEVRQLATRDGAVVERIS